MKMNRSAPANFPNGILSSIGLATTGSDQFNLPIDVITTVGFTELVLIWKNFTVKVRGTGNVLFVLLWYRMPLQYAAVHLFGPEFQCHHSTNMIHGCLCCTVRGVIVDGSYRCLGWNIDNRSFSTGIDHFLCYHLADVYHCFKIDIMNAGIEC